jgi:transcriptional regulator with XRE-family HTH domain
MATVSKIHASKQPNRPHHIVDWAEKRGLSQAELAEELGADKSVVSRWFNGTSPGLDWQEKLADFFGCSREALFRHPDEDWVMQFFRNRSQEEIDRIKATLETAFPLKRSG